ncbi:MAG: aminomethyl-transferring glycine dehydrogenase subunit GcvPA [Deltaproteobacteria bacterium]|nr:aminomethyl-transferring glycine dehydrogenase subunit GcvPA [Deltaproteobacteria bacterium]
MRYLPHTDDEITSMLDTVGATDLEDLYSAIPEDCRPTRPPDIPGPLSEWDLIEHMARLAGSPGAGPARTAYLGAGRYDHYIPACIDSLLSRSEFSTAYTPYQPEVSQGTLQGIYEYQTLMARFLGLEVSNASLYDGASALAEALLMAVRVTRRKKVALSRLIHPHYRRVVETYLVPAGVQVTELPQLENGRTDPSALWDAEDLAAVAVQSPNFLGCIEKLAPFGAMARDKEALMVTCFTEPLAYGILKSPGSQGAHIACGEGQSLGIPMSFGGPGLGIFTTRKDHVRQMPGRVVGKTVDKEGKQGFVLTLATREQHIRRDKATSNICTNSSLCALSAAMYMAALGGSGIRELAQLNHDKAAYLKTGLEQAGCTVSFEAPFFNEFVIAFPGYASKPYERLMEKGMVAGLPLGTYDSQWEGMYLLCVTETRSRADMDRLIEEVSRLARPE